VSLNSPAAHYHVYVTSMMKQRRTIAVLTMTLITISALSSVFYVNGQTPQASTELVKLAEGASQQVKSLIDSIFANETALQTIDNSSLLGQLSGNVTRYTEGAEKLTQAQNQLENSNYAEAVAFANEALGTFRDSFKSINRILANAGLQNGTMVDAQGLLDAYSRALERTAQLRLLLPSNATEALGLLDQAETHLDMDTAEDLLVKGNVNAAVSNFSQANQLIMQVYQYVKTQAEESNAGRINSYCEMIREQATERFRYGSQQGINATDFLGQLGYQDETQFMATLQTMTQTAQGDAGNIQTAMQELEAVGQMVQEMNQALNQEINRRQGGSGMGGGGSGTGGNGSGTNAGSGTGTVGGNDGPGNGGNQ
jgi:hypothetical protein